MNAGPTSPDVPPTRPPDRPPHPRTSAHPKTVNPLLGPGLQRLRRALADETVDPWTLWYFASEGLAAWIRALERALGDHLDDRQRARALIVEACKDLYLRRISALPEPLAQTFHAALPTQTRLTEIRAFFEALYPGPLARSIRWSLSGLSQDPPDLSLQLQAWRRMLEMDPRTRWLEVSHHLGELAIVLTERLPQHQVPRAVGWLGDVCYQFGREVGELATSTFDMPRTLDSAIEVLRMGELLFRVNPEHLSGLEPDTGIGFIEGNACLWYERPGWGPMHCGVLGRFQAGLAEVFDFRYSLTKTIPKNGGNTCRISLTPLKEPLKEPTETPGQVARPTAAPNVSPQHTPPPWQPPTTLLGNDARASMMTSFAQGRNPAHGFFGPDTLVWNCTRETAMLLGGGRAALMQLAHPAVAHAIRDHSAVHHDRIGRFARTMLSAYGVLFGSVDDALGITDRVHRIHGTIAGRLDDVPGLDAGHYHALDGEATFWVGATLIDTSMLIYEQVVHPFTREQRDQLVREAGAFWGLFGVPLKACPTSWAELHGYVERRSESLAPLIGPSARREAHLLFEAHPPFLQPLFDQLKGVTAYLLPTPLRQAFDMELEVRERLTARSWMLVAEQLVPRMPPLLRFVPHYHRALYRIRRKVH